MNFLEPPCQPCWALTAAELALAVLFVILIGIMAWPLGRRCDAVDPHAEPFGDQPKLPQAVKPPVDKVPS